MVKLLLKLCVEKFSSVNFFSGETGHLIAYNRSTYENAKTRIKMDKKLSLPLEETLGVGQGKIRSSDHYIIYINTVLETLESAQLGVNIGPVNVGSCCVADDLYLLTDCQIKLQCMLDISQHYGRNFRYKFGTEKTVVSVVGSQQDMTYYD